jgi:hypothetical protein
MNFYSSYLSNIKHLRGIENCTSDCFKRNWSYMEISLDEVWFLWVLVNCNFKIAVAENLILWLFEGSTGLDSYFILLLQ